MRVLDETVGKLGNVHEAILMHANIYEGTEGGDIGDRAFEQHTGLQVLDVVDAVGKGRGLEARARVTAGLFQFGKNVLHRRQAESLIHEDAWVERLQGGAVAHDGAQVAATGGDDLLGDAVGFRVHGGRIERLLAVRNAQEAGALFEGAGAETRHLHQFLAAIEGAVGIAVRNDGFSRGFSEAGNTGEQRRGGRVEIDADSVHRIFDDGIERAAEAALIDIVLVLADADRFRIDLDEFGERVLQAAGDGDGAAQRHVETGEFIGRGLRGGIDGGACLRDDDLGRLRGRQLGEHVRDEAFRLAAAGAVADGDQLDLVLAHEAGEFGLRAADIVLRREGIDGGRLKQLAGPVHNGDLDARADAGIEPHGGAGTGGRGQQQILQIAGENVDRLLFRPFAQFAHQVERQRHGELDPPCPADDLHQPLVARQGRADRIGGGDGALDRLDRRGIVLIDDDVDREHFLVPAAQHRERPVAWHRRPAFGMIEIIGEFGAGFLLPLDDAGAQLRGAAHVGAQAAKQVGIFGDTFGNDVAGAFESRLHVGDIGGEESLGALSGGDTAVEQNGFGKWRKAAFAGDFRLGAALGLVGQIDVFKLGLGGNGGDLGGKFVGKLVLAADRIEDRGAAGFQLAQIDQPFRQGAQLRVVEATGHFLAITGDEGHGRALVQKLHGGGHLGRRGIDLACDENGNRRCGSGFGRTGHGIPSGNERARDHKCAEHEGQVRARTVGAASTDGCGISKA